MAGLILIGASTGNLAERAPLAAMALAIVLVPAWLVLLVRAARARVEVSPAGVRVRRVFSTRTIGVDDYDGVTWNATLFPAGVSLAIRRRSGRPVSAPSAIGMLHDPLRPVEDEVAEIGQQIALALSGPPAGSLPQSVQ